MGEHVPFRGVRKVIADRMRQSLQGTAQLSYHAMADVSAIMALGAGWKGAGRSVGLQDCLLAALTDSLQRHPALNGSCDETGYTPADDVRIALALASPGGLVTPVLSPLAGLGLDAIGEARRSIVARAQAGALKVGDFKGGTFTLSNLGLTAVQYFTPILNTPQIAILGIGRVAPTVALNDRGALFVRQLLPLSLTADHRVVDGDPAGRFLTDVGTILEKTDWALR